MANRLLRSNALRVTIIVMAMILAGFVFMVQPNPVSAQTGPSQLIVGLQNDMTTLNWFDPATNTVWKSYQLEYNFEALYTLDPSSNVYPDLANQSMIPTTTCQSVMGSAAWVQAPYPGMCYDGGTGGSGLNFTVFINPAVYFTDGTPMNASDVIFTYQTLAWSTYASSIYQALWFPQPIAPLWNSTEYGGDCTPPAGMPYACMSHVAVFGVPGNSHAVRFQLLPVSGGAYALFFQTTLNTAIIPEHIWASHIDPTAQANYSDPQSAPVSDTWDRSIDFSYSKIPGTIGTGPFYLDSWTYNQGSLVKLDNNYWGRGLGHVWQGVNYPFYPQINPATGNAYLQSIRFVIYSSLDVVSLALQQGVIDTLIWSLTPGFYTQVQSNPSITVDTVTDSGFYYLSFNLRKAPWGGQPYSLCLRQAISMAIDKNYIVNTLMGGFGVPGSVPISIINPAYINYSANAPAFDLGGIDAKLQSCGFYKDPNTGFYDAPDGTPITATILTPPKDYDPVRADAGIMISNNLKSVGLDINSAPTSFDTIVAKAFSPPVSFDIYVLGWSLGPYPETYLCSFFCKSQDPNINPAGSNSAGFDNATVNNLAANVIPYTVDFTTRVKQVQEVEGIVTNAIPWNVLYYKKDINAYLNTRWQGFIDNPFLNSLAASGGVFNGYSIASLTPAGSHPVPPPSGTLGVATTLPERVLANHVMQVPAYVSQNGVPADGATVWLNASLPSGTPLNSASATTDVTGHAQVSWTVPVVQGNIYLTVTAAKGSATYTATKELEVSVGPPAPMATLSLSTPTPVVVPGGTATVTAALVDGQGNPVAGQTVSIDTHLMLGTISSTSQVTDANGHATFTYSAPANTSLFPNANLLDTISANVSVPDTIGANTQSATLTVAVQNPNAPNFDILSVQSMSASPVLNTTSSSATITVKAAGFDGTGLSGVNVTSVNSDPTNLTVTPYAITDSSGIATFTATADATRLLDATINNTNVLVQFTAPYVSTSTSDSLEFSVGDNVANASYAAEISFGSRALAYVSTKATDTVTAHVWDNLGLPAAGVPVMFNIPLGDYGLPAQFPFVYNVVNVAGTGGGYQNIEYAGTGLELSTFFGFGSLGGKFQNSTGSIGPAVPADITQGPAYGVENMVNDLELAGMGNNYATNTSIDSCDPSTWPGNFTGLYYVNATSTTDSTGTYTSSFWANPEITDQRFQVQLYVGEPDLNVTVDACSAVASVSHSIFRIDSGVVSQRAPVFALGSWTISNPVYNSTSGQTQTITGTFYKLNSAGTGDVVASNVQVFALAGTGNALGAFGGTIATDGSGVATFSYKAPLSSLSTTLSFSFLPADPAYAFGARDQLFGDGYGDFWFGPTFEVLLAKFPYNFQVGYLAIPSATDFATATPASAILPIGGSTSVTVHVVNGANASIDGASVWSGGVQAVTDSSGNAVFTYTAGIGASEQMVVVTTADGQVLRAWFGLMAAAPLLTYGGIAQSVGVAGQTSTFSLTVTNVLPVAGTSTVVLMVDGSAVAAQSVSLSSLGSTNVSLSYAFPAAKQYTVAIGTQSISVTVGSPESTVGSLVAYALAGGLLVVGLVVGAIVGLMLSRRRKKPTMAMPEETEKPAETKPAEEELGPEEKL